MRVHVYIYMCVCVCVREREREREGGGATLICAFIVSVSVVAHAHTCENYYLFHSARNVPSTDISFPFSICPATNPGIHRQHRRFITQEYPISAKRMMTPGQNASQCIRTGPASDHTPLLRTS